MLKSVAVGATAALTLGLIVLPQGNDTGAADEVADRPPAPAVLEATSGTPVVADDGLVRLIVRPTGVPDSVTAPTSAWASSPAPEGSESGIGATDGASDWTIDGGEGELVIVEGELMRRDADGALVPVGGADATPPPDEAPVAPAAPAVSHGHPTIDLLAGRDGVESVTAIGDGSFAVAVTDETVLDDLPVDTTPDIPLALFADPYESYQWALENTGTNLAGVSGAPAQSADADIDVTVAWPTATGEGVVVAVVDSGVDFSHPDLTPNRWVNDDETCGNGVDDDGNGYVDDCHGWDFAYEDARPFNPGAHPHGTHVAGIVAAESGNGLGVSGVAPDARIMDLNVGAITPSGEPAIATSSIARAVRYAADNGADVINLSLGTPPGTPRWAMSTLESAIVYAGQKGALIVVAAGNDSASLDGGNTAWPASYDFPYVVTVAASAPDETLASFSNHGTVVDVAAPGHVILSTAPAANGSYVFMSGTSQASPVVAGIAALALDAEPTLTATDLRDRLRSSADRHDAYVGRVPDGLRANAGNLVVGATPEVGFDDVAVSVRGLVGATDAAPLTASLDIVVPTDEYEEPYSWSATLVAMTADGDFVIVDHEVAVDGAPLATDEDGAVNLGLEGSGTVALATTLPSGRYALVLEAIADADPTARLGGAFVAAFDVADSSSPVTTTTAAPAPVPTTTLAPGSPSGPVPTTTVAPTPTILPPAGAPTPTTTVTAPTPAVPSPDPVPTTTAPIGSPTPTPTTTVPAGSMPVPTTTPPSDGTSNPTPPPPTSDPVPTTTIPAGTPPPTTTAPVAPPTTAAPISAGGWTVSAVLPAEGPTDTMNAVRLTGSFPEAAYVWFGDQPGIVLAGGPYTIDVLTPVRSTAGAVDISLIPPGAPIALTVPAGYTFVGPDGGGSAPTPSPTEPGGSSDLPTTTTTVPAGPTPSPPGSPTPTDPSPNPTDPAPSPTTTVPGGVSPMPTTVAPDPGVSPAPTTTAAPAPGETVSAGPRQARASLGDRIDLGGGLQGRRIVGFSPVSAATLCTSDPCSLT